MEIVERTVNDVTVLDLKGKMTLGEGDELLKDKINSLLAAGKKKLLLNLEEETVKVKLAEAMQRLYSAEQNKNGAEIQDILKNCQDLSAKISELRAKRQALIIT